MKKLLLISTFLFSTLMFSTPAYSEWTKVSKGVDGRSFYLDFDRIRKHDGYIYLWILTDYLKPTKYDGTLSIKVYTQNDCELFRYKYLTYIFHKEPMGGGIGDTLEPPEGNKGWKYPSPNSSAEEIIKQVCNK
jgi:hypothetical protein